MTDARQVDKAAVCDPSPAEPGPSLEALPASPGTVATSALTVGEMGYWELALNSGSVRTSAATDRIFGLEHTGQRALESYLKRVHPADLSLVDGILRNPPPQFRVEVRIYPRDKDGPVWLAVQGEQWPASSDGTTLLVGAVSDVSVLKHTEALLHKQTLELEARVRELNCLYAVSRLVQQQERLENLFERVVNIIPDGFSEPDTISVRLLWGSRIYQSSGFSQSSQQLVQELIVQNAAVGQLQVYRRPGAFTRDFTPEEQALVQALRKPISRAIERKEVTHALRISENRWRTMAESLAEGLILYDREGRLSTWNRSAEQLLGLSLDHGLPLGFSGAMAVREDGSQLPVEEFPAYITRTTGAACDGTVLGLRRSDQQISWLSVNTRALVQTEDQPPYPVVASFTDISEHKRSERERALLAAIVEASPDGIASTDLEGQITSWNPGAERMYGYTPEEIVGKNISVLMPPESRDELSMILGAIAKGKGVTYFDAVRVHKNGQRIDVSVAVTPITDANGRVQGAAKIDRDITERKRMEEQLHHDAFHDRLTGVANRSLFMDRLDHVVARADRFGEPYAVFVMDMDNFKLINDRFGHQVGDQLLCAFVERIQELLRPMDTLARFGGDEFTLLLEETENKGSASQIAARILESLRRPFRLGKHEIQVSSSIGIMLDESGCRSADEALRNADVALYEAKRQGKNQFVVFDARMRGEEVSRMYMESELRQALQENELSVQFQPIVELASGEPVGGEALARWKHEVMGRVEPERFIDVAEETGLITPLGRFVLERACATLSQWLQEPGFPDDFYISVNVSPKEFYSGDLVPFIGAMIDQYRLQGFNLRLEITESVIIQHDREAAAILKELQQLGVKTCLDDFGTGYSSLSYLHQLPFDVIKVDRSFIQRLAEQKQSREIVRSILGLARALGMETIAEGAESPEHLEEVRALGFRWAQGYGLFRPMAPDSLWRLFD